MKRRVGVVSLAALFMTPALAPAAGNPTVSYSDGKLTVICSNAPLAQVFEQIKVSAGIELLLEDPVKNTLLTANIEGQPVRLAIERLLEGSGVNYAVFFDRHDWQQVDKIFIGEGGGGSPSPSGPAATPARRMPSRQPTPTEEDVQDEYVEEEVVEPEEDPVNVEEQPADVEPPPAEMPDDPSEFQPPTPSFPRSPFTPGLESSPFGPNNRRSQSRATTPAPDTGTEEPPPAYYPFLDPLGRPIPVPPGTMNPPEQEQPTEQQQQKKNQ